MKKRILQNKTINAADYKGIALEIAERLDKSLDDQPKKNLKHLDDGHVIKIEESLRNFKIFSPRDFPIMEYKETIEEYLKLKKQELKFLKTNEIISNKLFINLEDIHKIVMKLESENKLLGRLPAVIGRREEFFLKELIIELLRIWNTKKPIIKLSNELTSWIEFSVSKVTTTQSTEALIKRISRIIKENKALQGGVKS